MKKIEFSTHWYDMTLYKNFKNHYMKFEPTLRSIDGNSVNRSEDALRVINECKLNEEFRMERSSEISDVLFGLTEESKLSVQNALSSIDTVCRKLQVHEEVSKQGGSIDAKLSGILDSTKLDSLILKGKELSRSDEGFFSSEEYSYAVENFSAVITQEGYPFLIQLFEMSGQNQTLTFLVCEHRIVLAIGLKVTLVCTYSWLKKSNFTIFLKNSIQHLYFSCSSPVVQLSDFFVNHKYKTLSSILGTSLFVTYLNLKWDSKGFECLSSYEFKGKAGVLFSDAAEFGKKLSYSIFKIFGSIKTGILNGLFGIDLDMLKTYILKFKRK
jgi:hypothetical protein